MKLVSAQQMTELDKAAIEGHNIPSLVLMERAACAVADFVFENSKKKSAVILCGPGNNGGDGLAAARMLIEKGFQVEVFIFARSHDLSPDARANWERLIPLTSRVYEITSFEELKNHHPVISGSGMIVDAVFGTGLTREITGTLAEIVEYINTLKNFVLAVDVPSGLCATTGRVLGAAIKADHTITFGLPKLGLYAGGAAKFAGRVTVADIGIPNEEIERLNTPFRLTDESELKGILQDRSLDSHKGTFGHVAVIAGSGGKLGAGYLSSMAALRTGAGLVTYFLPAASFDKFDSRHPEVMCEPVEDKGRGHFHPDGIASILERIKSMDVLAIGPAIGTHPETAEFVEKLLPLVDIPIIIDADGLNNIKPKLLASMRARHVITPHPGEFSRLTGLSTTEVQEKRLPLALKFAAEFRTNLLLKGHNTIIATDDGRAFINTTGNPAMATAGMGDVLTGVIEGFAAQGVSIEMAAAAGAYIHGIAGDMASKEIGERGVVASDVIKRLPIALTEVFKK